MSAKIGKIEKNGNTASGKTSGNIPGKVSIVGAGPGDPELVTLKAVRLLHSADVVIYDRLVNPQLLEHTRSGVRKISVGKQPGKPSISQHDINRTLIREAESGKKVVRLKGGDPFIFGRGGEECMELAKSDIPFEVVPGISSVSGATAYAGIPLTLRHRATGFTVISGHLHPDSRSYDWSVLSETSTLVILMGMRNLNSIIHKLVNHGKSGDTPIALIRWGTTQGQDVITGRLDNIAEKTGNMTAPVTIVIGEVARYHETLNWFDPKESEFAARRVGSDPENTDTLSFAIKRRNEINKACEPI